MESQRCIECGILTYRSQPYCPLHAPREDDDWFLCKDCGKQFHLVELNRCNFCGAEVCNKCDPAHWAQEDHSAWYNYDENEDLPEPAEPFLVVKNPDEPKPVEDDPLKPKPRLFLW